MTFNELSAMFNGQVPDELAYLVTEMQCLVAKGLKPTVKSCLTADGTKRYYYVAADTTYQFNIPITALTTTVTLRDGVWSISYRHGNVWLRRNNENMFSRLANRPLDQLEPIGSGDELGRWVWDKVGWGTPRSDEGKQQWRLVHDVCRRLFEADSVPEPKEEPKQKKVRQPREPREPRVAKKDVAGPNLGLDF